MNGVAPSERSVIRTEAASTAATGAGERSGSGKRVFLSYGHRDATELALRLREGLEASGYSVWQDEKRIRAGHAWTDEIRQGLRESDLVVAVLSPYAVRRKGWDESPSDDDSVCLDEIEYAVDACKVPVLPVMAVSCEPPFRIFRLQYLDFRGWQESAARYDELEHALLTATAECLAAGRAPLRSWARLPEPWDFTAFLSERRRRFVGRRWLFDALRDRLAETTSPAILLTGSPGVGKSAFFASLVHANPAGQILAYHCCQAATPATLSPAVFVRSVAAMIAARDPVYAEMIEHPDTLSALDEAAVALDPASAFEQVVLNPLCKLAEPESAPRLLMIDALDEALGWSGSPGPNLLDLLSAKLTAFPEWLKVVATTRDESAVKRRFRAAETLSLDDAKTENEVDLRVYANDRLDAHPELLSATPDAGREEIVKKLLTRAEGNFLVLVQTLDAVERGLFDLAELDALAPGLDPVYEQFFDRLFERAGVDYGPSRTLLQCILAAQEPRSRDELAAVTGLDAESDLPPLLARLGSFVPPRSGRYSPFHKTLVEWLTGWDAEEDQPVAGDYYISLKSGHRLWANRLLPRYDSGPSSWDLYLRRHLPSHLAGSEHWDEVSDVLLDLRYLESVAQGPGTVPFDLLADFDLVLRAMPETHEKRRLVFLVSEILRLDAAFVAQFPESLFQCLWNRGRWHDSSAARAFFAPVAGSVPPWERPEPKLSTLVDRWRVEKEQAQPGFPWLRALRPLPEALGSAQRGIIRAEGDGFKTVTVSPDGTRIIASLPERGPIGSWDALSVGAEPVVVDFTEDKSVWCVRYFTAGPHRGLAAGVTWDGRLILLDDALQVVDEAHGTDDNFGRVAVSPDGMLIATGDWKGAVTLWAADTLSPRYSWQAHGGEVTALEFSPCGRFLASGEHGEPSFVLLWAADAEKPTPVAQAEARGWVESIAFDATGAALYWGDYDGNVERWEWSTSTRSVLRSTPHSPASVVRLVDGRLLCGVGGAFDPVPIEVWNLAESALEQRLRGHLFGVGDIALVPGTKRFVSVGDATLRIWDLGVPDEPPVDLVEPEVSWTLFCEPQGWVITAAETSDTVWVRKLADGSVVWALDDHGRSVSAITASADGKTLACGAGDGTVHLWDLERGTRTWHERRHDEPVEVLAFSFDGSMVASGGGDGHVCLSGTEDGRLLRRAATPNRDDWLQTLAFSHDGTLVASGGLSTLSVWKVKSGKVVRKLSYTTHYRLWFAPGDEVLIAQGPGEAPLGWQIATGEPLAAGPDLQALYDTAMLRAGRRWTWDDSTDTRPDQMSLALVDGSTGARVAHFPEVRGFIQWHPGGRIWVNQRSRQVFLLQLEGGEVAPSSS